MAKCTHQWLPYQQVEHKNEDGSLCCLTFISAICGKCCEVKQLEPKT